MSIPVALREIWKREGNPKLLKVIIDDILRREVELDRCWLLKSCEVEIEGGEEKLARSS